MIFFPFLDKYWTAGKDPGATGKTHQGKIFLFKRPINNLFELVSQMEEMQQYFALWDDFINFSLPFPTSSVLSLSLD